MADLHFSPLVGALAALFIATLIVGFYFIAKCSRNRPQLPPGPNSWPIFGSLFTMLCSKPTFRWIHNLMKDMNLELMCLRFCSVHVIIVTSPEIARECLRRQDANFMSRPFCISAFLTSGGFLTAALSPLGDQWQKMRRILTSHVLSNARHMWLHDKRAEEADHLVRYVFNQCGFSRGVVNVRITAQHFCGNVIRKIIFGKRFFSAGAEDGGPGAEEVEHVGALFTTLNYLYSFCVSDYVPWLRTVTLYVLQHCPSIFGKILDFDGHVKIIQTAIASIRKYQDPEVDERIRQWANGTRTQQEDLLDVLINLRDDAGIPVLTYDEIKSQIVELMMATVDNPSNAVEWAIAEMINQPHILHRAWEELDRVVGKDRFVQESDLTNLNYIKACACEAFRLHPIAPFNMPHVAVRDTEVCGFFIPKGSHLLLSRPGLGRNTSVWEDSLRYDPAARHLVEGRDVVLTDHELRLLSFSTGRRGCAGVLLGSTMTAMLLARLLQAFTWEVAPCEDGIDLREADGELLMAKPLLAAVSPRLAPHLYSPDSCLRSDY